MAADVTLDMVQELRRKTGAGMMDCKKALVEASGDMEAAIDILRKRGEAIAQKRAFKTASQGRIAAYLHPGDQVGVMVEVNCETDFVARTDEVKEFARDICMHIAAMKPICIRPEDLSPEFLEREKNIIREQLRESGKPEAMFDKIMEGKLKKIYSDICLLEQKFVKDDKLTVDQVLKNLIVKTGEKVQIRRFVRFAVGEEILQ